MKLWPFSRSEKPATSGAMNMGEYLQYLRERAFDAQLPIRELAAWHWDGGFDNLDIIGALPTIRARSRDMAKNSPLYARYIQLMRENVVGDGFRFKSLPFIDAKDQEAIDREAAKRIEYHWWKWTHDPSMVDTGRRQNLTQILSLAVENWTRDGEAFITLDFNAQNRYGISVRIVRSDCVDETVNSDNGGATVTRGGIEFNRDTNAPVAYYFNGSRADGYGDIVYRGKTRIRIPAEYVIHLYERHDAGQIRGVPLGYSALVPLKMLDEYTKAELTAARFEACTMAVMESPYFDGQQQYTVKDGQRKKAMEIVKNGEFLTLPPGYKFSGYTPSHPNRGWKDFSIALQRQIATGLGVDFAELTGNGEGTISAVARQSMLRTREMYKDRQRTVATLVLNRLFHAWLRSFLRLSASGDFTLEDYERLVDHEFQGRRWGWIEPTAEVNAAATAVSHGWRTDAEIAAEYGNDIDDCLEEATRIRPKKEEAGLITVGFTLADQGNNGNGGNQDTAETETQKGDQNDGQD